MLVFTLKKQWFEKIKSGEKTIEYREVKPYWTHRLQKDEPCERCKNCIKCEGGYYQLGETEKDEQLTKAKEILEDIIKFQPYIDRDAMFLTRGNDWKEVIFKAEQFIKDSKVEK